MLSKVQIYKIHNLLTMCLLITFSNKENLAINIKSLGTELLIFYDDENYEQINAQWTELDIKFNLMNYHSTRSFDLHNSFLNRLELWNVSSIYMFWEANNFLSYFLEK